MHVAAAAIALAQDRVERAGPADSTQAPSSRAQLIYRLKDQQGVLGIERAIRGPKGTQPLTGTLVAYMGGVQSGRIAGPAPTLSQEDYRLDQLLTPAGGGRLPEELAPALLKLFAELPHLEWEGRKLSARARPVRPEAEIVEGTAGEFLFHSLAFDSGQVLHSFTNGWQILEGDLLATDPLRVLPAEWRPLWKAPARLEDGQRVLIEKKINTADAARWTLEVLPRFEAAGVRVYVKTQRWPRRMEAEPRIELRLQPRDDGGLSVLPELVYARGPEIFARIDRERLHLLRENVVFTRDPSAEKRWVRKLQQELHLSPGQLAHFPGSDSIAFRKRLENWTNPNEAAWAIPGGELSPDFAWDGTDRMSFQFRVESESGPGALIDAGEVLRAWQNGEGFVRLLSGSAGNSGWAAIPHAWLEKNGRALAELFEAQRKTGKVPRALLPALVELSASGSITLPEALQTLSGRLGATGEDVGEETMLANLPESIRGLLRPYQRDGVLWLKYRRGLPLAALLADDMGLGKTIQTLAAIQDLPRTLIVAPTSVMPAWRQQVERFLPGTTVNTYHGPDRTLDTPAQLTLTTYTLLRQDLARFLEIEWDAVVLDEAQAIKNPDSQVARSAIQLKSKWRLALSGTPIENRPLELWSLFRYLEPEVLGERDAFEERWAGPLRQGNPEVLRKLRGRIQPFLLRRKKSEVASELPPKTELVLHAELSTTERELYDGLFAMARKEAMAMLERDKSVFGALEALLRLRQACCHPKLLPAQEALTSSKIELLRETLRMSRENGHRVLIFSQWTRFLDLVEPMLKEEGFSFERLDGSVPAPEREARMNRFQSPDGAFAFLLSLKAGGTGLTLTAADQVFLLDPWWNPFVEDQAADRAHRIGQSLPVTVYRLVARGTLEERILALQAEKRALAQGLIDPGYFPPDEEGHAPESAPVPTSWGLKREDIEKLLQPL